MRCRHEGPDRDRDLPAGHRRSRDVRPPHGAEPHRARPRGPGRDDQRARQARRRRDPPVPRDARTPEPAAAVAHGATHEHDRPGRGRRRPGLRGRHAPRSGDRRARRAPAAHREDRRRLRVGACARARLDGGRLRALPARAAAAARRGAEAHARLAGPARRRGDRPERLPEAHRRGLGRRAGALPHRLQRGVAADAAPSRLAAAGGRRPPGPDGRTPDPDQRRRRAHPRAPRRARRAARRGRRRPVPPRPRHARRARACGSTATSAPGSCGR